MECMKNLYIVANWKSNKTIYQTEEWFRPINTLPVTFNKEEKEVIVCAPFTLLSKVKELTVNCKLSIVVGAQDISSFEEGAYTGEVSAKQIKELAEFVIIGHSERRKIFLESIEMINLKITQAFKYGLTPIVCVSSLDQAKALRQAVGGNSQFIVAYEPLFAIGSGIVDTPESADQMARGIKAVLGEIHVLYGGSVTSKNIGEFSKASSIDGSLIGKASLDAKEFYAIIQNA